MKKRIGAFLLALLICVGLIGCKGGDMQQAQASQAPAEPSESVSPSLSETVAASETPAVKELSTEVTEVYQSQDLIMEMLVNSDCLISKEDYTLAVVTPNGYAAVSVGLISGIQNLNASGKLLPSLLKDSYNATPGEVANGYLLGARAKHCTYSSTNESGLEVMGILATAIVNQSMYMVDVTFSEGCTDADAELITNVFRSMNVLTPTLVDTAAKTAKYESRYPNAKPAKAVKNAKPVTQWVYLPYYYYGWSNYYDWTIYESYYFEPDWDYYADDTWWSWGWDDGYDWGFYDEYGYWYDESYHDYYYDYYYNYDPWSDPGDELDTWSYPDDYYFYDSGEYYDFDYYEEYYDDYYYDEEYYDYSSDDYSSDDDSYDDYSYEDDSYEDYSYEDYSYDDDSYDYDDSSYEDW